MVIRGRARKKAPKVEELPSPQPVTHNLDGHIMQGDIDLVGYDVILRTKIAGAKALGYKNPQDVLGACVYQFVHPDYYDVVKQRIYRMKTENKSVDLQEEKFIHKDGHTIDAETIAFLHRLRDPPAVFHALEHDLHGLEEYWLDCCAIQKLHKQREAAS